MIRRYPARPGCFTFAWSWTVACVLALGGCTLRGDGIPTPAWRDAGTGGNATGGAEVLPAEFDPSAIAAEVWGAMPPPLDPDSPRAAAPVVPLDLTGAYVFPAQPEELAAELWGAAPFSISQAIQPSTRARNIAQYGTDSIGPGTVRRAPGGALEVMGFGTAEWIPYDRSVHLGAVRMQARYGSLWWGVGSMDPHDFAQGDYLTLSLRDPIAWPVRISIGAGPPRFPGDQPLTDVSYDSGLYCRVRTAIGRPCGTTSTGGGEIFEVVPERLEVTATSAAAGSAVVSLDIKSSRRWRPVVERSGLPIPPGIVPPPLVTVVVAPDQLHPAGRVLLAVSVSWPAGLPPGIYDRSVIVLSAGGGTESKRRVPLVLTVRDSAPPPPPDPIPEPPPPPDPEPPPGPECERWVVEAEPERCPVVEVDPVLARRPEGIAMPCTRTIRYRLTPCGG